MSSDQTTSPRSRWIRVLRRFLPADADTVRGCLAVLLAAVGGGLLVRDELVGIQIAPGSASWLYWLSLLLPSGVVLLLFIRACLMARSRRWSTESLIWRSLLLVGAVIFSAGVVGFLNRALDDTAARDVELTVTDRFVLHYHRKGDDEHIERQSFVAFDTPEPLARFRLVGDIASDYPEIARTRALELRERFTVPGHPGWLGLPWYEFKAASRLTLRLGRPAGIGRLADAICYDKKTFKREVAKRNIVFVKAEGCFTLDSPSTRQLQHWGVPIVEQDNCPH